MNKREIPSVWQQSNQLEPTGKALGEVNFKFAFVPTLQNIFRCLFWRDDGGHFKVVVRGQWCLHKAGMNHAHVNALGLEVKIEHLRQMSERRFGGTIGQAIGQAAKARNA